MPEVSTFFLLFATVSSAALTSVWMIPNCTFTLPLAFGFVSNTPSLFKEGTYTSIPGRNSCIGCPVEKVPGICSSSAVRFNCFLISRALKIVEGSAADALSFFSSSITALASSSAFSRIFSASRCAWRRSFSLFCASSLFSFSSTFRSCSALARNWAASCRCVCARIRYSSALERIFSSLRESSST